MNFNFNIKDMLFTAGASIHGATNVRDLHHTGKYGIKWGCGSANRRNGVHFAFKKNCPVADKKGEDQALVMTRSGWIIVLVFLGTWSARGQEPVDAQSKVMALERLWGVVHGKGANKWRISR